MENSEDAFAAEARDEAVELGRRELQQDAHIASGSTGSDEGRSEDTPLLSKSLNNIEQRFVDETSESYVRALNQPWTGAHGSEGLPWYRKPSVSQYFTQLSARNSC